jgi:predicted PurR-regulated permease PerM
MLHAPRYRFLFSLQAILLTVTVLYFGRPVLLPIVTAILLTFLLRPAVVWLERHRIPRVPAVGIVILSIVLTMISIGWTLGRQFQSLALNLDEYRGHLREKVEALQFSRNSGLGKLSELAREVSDAARGHGHAGADEDGAPATVVPALPGAFDAGETAMPHRSSAPPVRVEATAVPETVPVRIVPESLTTTDAVLRIWERLSTPLAMTAIVLVLVMFMLVSFEELRNRLLRLAGETRLTLTTKTLDDIGKRISRYLVMNALVNGGFGAIVFAGLSAIGVEFAALWGFLAALCRFVPYVGAVVSVILPLGMAIIQFPDWTHPFLVLGLFLVLELATNYVVEPLTYGKAAGVSTVALLIAAAFWSWIWGPMGLILSVPLVVVLAVIGRHIPQFEALAILLGDEPPLTPGETLYQRLLAGDPDEAEVLLVDALAARGRQAAYDEMLVPALALAERDFHRGRLSDEEKMLVWDRVRELVADHSPAAPAEADSDWHATIAGVAARDIADEAALTMLQHVAAARCRMILEGPDLMASEKIALLDERQPDAVLISSVGPGDASHVRYLCKRMRQEHPRLRIIVGRWGFRGDRERLTERLRARGADQLVTSFAEALDAIERIQPVSLSA